MWYHLFVSYKNENSTQIAGDILNSARLLIHKGVKDVLIFASVDVQNSGKNYYFNEQAAPIALSFGANLCDKPIKEKAGSLFAGSQDLIDSVWENNS